MLQALQALAGQPCLLLLPQKMRWHGGRGTPAALGSPAACDQSLAQVGEGLRTWHISGSRSPWGWKGAG